MSKRLPVIHTFEPTQDGSASVWRGPEHVCVASRGVSGSWLCAILDSAYLAGAADVGKAVRTAIGIDK